MRYSFGWSVVWKIIILLLLALIIGRFLVLGSHKVLINHQSSDGDENAYLSLGLALKEAGVLSDGTRPPLYPFILSFFAEREWSYFTTAKQVTLWMSALAIGATFLVGVKMFSWETGLLAAFLLAVNKEFHARSVTIYADNLLMLIMLGCWYFLIKSLTGWKSCVMAGIFVGLAFLTKGSAPLLLAAWGLTALLHFRLRIFRHVELLLVPLFFVITALPLLIYNANHFGSPTYNFATSHIMWMDQLAEIDTADSGDLPTASTYFATHSQADIIARIERGLRRLNPTIAETVIPTRTFEPAWLGPLLGVAAAGVFIYLLLFNRASLLDYLRQYKNTLVFTFFLLIFFYLSLVWYVAGSSAETRFIIPFLGPLYLLLANAAVTLGRGGWRRLGAGESRRPAWGQLGLGLAAALLLGWAVWWQVDTARAEAWALGVDPYEADRSANTEVEQIVQWLAADHPAGEVLVAFGPSKSLPLWKFPAHFTVERLPYEIDTWAEIQAYVQERSPDYIIIDDDTVRRRRQAVSGYFQRQDGLIHFEQLPPGWALDYVYPTIPCKWCIFSPAPPADSVPLATFEHGLQLLDWRINQPLFGRNQPSIQQSDQPIILHPSSFIPHPLRLTLTWRAAVPLPDDYTVFVHLTAPDGFVKAQHDQPPFVGARPTSRWQPGEVYTDRYELTLDASVTPGDYLLLAGVYLPETGERLVMQAGPVGPTPGSVLLGRVRVAGE